MKSRDKLWGMMRVYRDVPSVVDVLAVPWCCQRKEIKSSQPQRFPQAPWESRGELHAEHSTVEAKSPHRSKTMNEAS